MKNNILSINFGKHDENTMPSAQELFYQNFGCAPTYVYEVRNDNSIVEGTKLLEEIHKYLTQQHPSKTKGEIPTVYTYRYQKQGTPGFDSVTNEMRGLYGDPISSLLEPSTRKNFVNNIRFGYDIAVYGYHDRYIEYKYTYDSDGDQLITYSEYIHVDCALKNTDKNFDSITKEVEQEVLSQYLQYKKTDDSRWFSMVTKGSQGDLRLQDFEIEKFYEDDSEVLDNYNDDFLPVHEKIVDELKKERSGLVLLHGLPGTGKTTYLRYLVHALKDKKIIFMPANMITALSSPDFIQFMSRNSNSILYVEDAENILRARESLDSSDQSVSNILNMGDGFLGDALKIQIVATFNCAVDKIDSALMRKGRLIATYNFVELTLEKTIERTRTLVGEEYVDRITKPLTLAEIYNMKEENFVKEVKKNRIGF